MTFDKSHSYTRNFTAVLVGLLSVEFAYHTVADEHVLHELSFLLLILLVGIKTRTLIRARVTNGREKLVLTRMTVLGACRWFRCVRA